MQSSPRPDRSGLPGGLRDVSQWSVSQKKKAHRAATPADAFILPRGDKLSRREADRHDMREWRAITQLVDPRRLVSSNVVSKRSMVHVRSRAVHS